MIEWTIVFSVAIGMAIGAQIVYTLFKFRIVKPGSHPREEWPFGRRRPAGRRAGERGNMFFMLFGAVAMVGVVGAGVMGTMRGPMSTMVEINRIEETKATMRVGIRMIAAASGQAALDPDGDGVTEPLEPDGGSGGVGGVPASTGAPSVDSWGTPLRYCAWDVGMDTGDPGDNDGEGNRIAGSDNYNDVVFALISAGPDRDFHSSNTCDAAPTIPLINTGNLVEGDDIIVALDYNEANAASGGLWEIQPDDPGATGAPEDFATIGENLNVTDTGTSYFGGGADFGGAVRARSSLLLPDDGELASCGSGNDKLVRVNDGPANDQIPVLEVCDGSSGIWEPASGMWEADAGGINYQLGNVGIGKASTANALDVAGITQLETLNASASADITGALGAGDTTLESLSVTGTSAFADTVIASTTAADHLAVAGTALVVGNAGNVGIGTGPGTDALDVAGNVNAGAIKLDGNTALDNAGSSSIFVGQGAASGTSGSLNTVVGAGAAPSLSDGEGNIILGAGTSDGSGTIVSNTVPDTPAGGTDNYLNIGNALIGDIATGDLTIQGSDGSAGALSTGTVNADNYNFGGNNMNPPSCTDAYDFARWTGTQWECVDVSAAVGGSSGVMNFIDLDDTPSSYEAGKLLRSGASGVEFFNCANNETLHWTGSAWDCTDGTSLAGAGKWEDAAETGDIRYNEADGDVLIGADSSAAQGINANGTADLFVEGLTTSQIFVARNGTEAAPGFTFLNSGNDTGIFSDTADTLGLSTAGTQRMVILPNGDIGIGTATVATGSGTNPQDLLMEVSGPLGATYYCDADGNNCFTADMVGTGLWAADDGGLNFIEYDDALGGMRVGASTPGRGPAPGWVIDAVNDLIFTSGKVGAGQYCDASGANCFDPATVGHDALSALGCAADEVPYFDGTSWGCTAIHDQDTLAGLSCGDGEIASWDAGGSAWICSSAGGLPSCSPNQILEHDGSAWQCVANDSIDTLAGLSCSDGQAVTWDNTGSAWVCTDISGSDTLAGLSCTSGQVASWDGSAWVCADQTGGGSKGFAVYDSNTSLPDGTPTDLTFTGIRKNDFDAAAWDGTTFTIPSGEDGWYVLNANYQLAGSSNRKPGIGITISTEADCTTRFATADSGTHNVTTSCVRYLAAGTTLSVNGSQFSGGTLAPTGEDFSFVKVGSGGSGGGSDTLSGLSCSSGQVAKWNGSAWVCSDISAGGGAGTGGIELFTADGTWTNPDPSGSSYARIECWGGGGGGAKDSAHGDANGGGGGGYGSRLMQLSALPSSASVTIGPGGAGRSGSDGAGANGGDTSFGTILTATGGLGGENNGSNTVPLGGGFYYDGNSADLARTGGNGAYDCDGIDAPSTGAAFAGGGGGCSDVGEGGDPPPPHGVGGGSERGGSGGAGDDGVNGQDGRFPGGGGGGSEDASGGSGASGMCMVTYLGGGGASGSGTDTLAGLSCTDGQVASWDDGGSQWVCSSLGGLPTCTANEILEHDGSAWQCVADTAVGLWSDDGNGFAQHSLSGGIRVNKETGMDPPPAGSSGDTLVDLSCGNDEIAKWNGSAWACAADSTGGNPDWSDIQNRPAGLDDGDDVGITSESDPTVQANVKDGVSWSELSGIPAGFADGTDDGADNLGNHTATQALNMSGNNITSAGDVTANAFLYASDARLKANIEDMADARQKLSVIRGVTYHYQADATHKKRIGVLAQDVALVYPEAVTRNPNGIMAVDYPALVPVLIKAVNELSKEVNRLDGELRAMNMEAAE